MAIRKPAEAAETLDSAVLLPHPVNAAIIVKTNMVPVKFFDFILNFILNISAFNISRFSFHH